MMPDLFRDDLIFRIFWCEINQTEADQVNRLVNYIKLNSILISNNIFSEKQVSM